MKIARVFRNPWLAFKFLANKGVFDWMSDEMYLKFMFRAILRRKLDLKNPQTFCEKLQWLKLHDRKPEYTIMADKIKAKEWVAKRIGKEHIIPTLGVWDNPNDIDFDKLPNQFVLKCNHNSGTGMYICKDKSKMDIEAVKKGLRKGLKENYYLHRREWPYKDISRKILAEKFIVENSGEESSELTDYKFFCFNGTPKFMYVSNDLSKYARTDFFDMDYNHLDMRMKDPNSENPPEMPKTFEEMKELAEILCKGLPFLRVDFYTINHKVYFGELTFYHNAGFFSITPEQWDKEIGSWIMI